MEHELANIEKYGWMGVVGLLMIKELISWFRGSTREYLRAVQQNTLAIVELKVKIKYLSAAIERIAGLEKDIQEAHKAIRKLRDFQ